MKITNTKSSKKSTEITNSSTLLLLQFEQELINWTFQFSSWISVEKGYYWGPVTICEVCLGGFQVSTPDSTLPSSSSSSMAKKPVKYTIVDAFTESAFKGNPAAVCLLDEEREQQWLQSVAAEFNLSETAFLITIHNQNSNPRFALRWFTPVAEVKLCGHATLASAHTLFSSGLVDANSIIEFVTLSGILTAKRIPAINEEETKDGLFYVELDFPVDPIKEEESNFAEISSQISEALSGANIIDLKRTQDSEDSLVVLESGEALLEVEPKIDAIVKLECARGLLVTAIAPPGSGFDFYSRCFFPKYGINEDPVTGSAHCALASYWCKKLGKCDFNAFQASKRGGVLNIHIDEKSQRVLLRGKAVTIMEGCVLV
ncbi:hypothetical protein AHAS_Ahas12G0224800 [Arachis hypogaea]